MNIRKLIKRGVITSVMASMVIMAAGCSKKESETIQDDSFVTPLLTPIGEPTSIPTPIPMTPAPGVTITPTAEPTKEPTPTPIVLITADEAEKKLKENIDTSIYTYELTNADLAIDGNDYFLYTIFEQGKAMEPNIAVERITGTLYVYDSDGNVTTFSRFPVDKTEAVDSGESEITVETALELLKKVTKEKLGLINNLSQYKIIADEWTTVVSGDVCYCFNVFESSEDGPLVGMYYVSTMGTAIYSFDEENGEFYSIN